jgi:hypothetical protein
MPFNYEKLRTEVQAITSRSSIRAFALQAGVSPATLSRFLGGTPPDLETAVSLCETMDRSLGEYHQGHLMASQRVDATHLDRVLNALGVWGAERAALVLLAKAVAVPISAPVAPAEPPRPVAVTKPKPRKTRLQLEAEEREAEWELNNT